MVPELSNVVGASCAITHWLANANINNGGVHPAREISTTINLVADTYYPIRIQFGENTLDDVCRFTFSNAGGLPRTTNGNGYFYQNH